jgi:hypothetical protein
MISNGKYGVLGLMLALAACDETPAATDAAADAATGQADAAGVPDFDLSGIDLGGVDLKAAQEQAEAAQRAMASGGELAKAKVLHYTVVGVNTAKHVQIPAADADQYGDIVEKVTLSFDWDVEKKAMIGAATIANAPAEVSNLSGMRDQCPAGEMKGPFELFDATEVRPMASSEGVLEVVGVRKHPDTMVAESCGAGRKLYKAAQVPVSTPIAPPEPGLFQVLQFAPGTDTIRLSADKKSVVMGSLNDTWEWTYTPTVK